MYVKRTAIRRPPPRSQRALLGFGDFTDNTQCSEIPLGDPYRRPGNYCATPDGGTTTFNSDGTTYRAPGYAVDPDPAHPIGASASSSSGGGFWDSVTKALTNTLAPTPPPVIAAPQSGGLSTGTIVAIAGGALVLAIVLARR